MKKINEIFYSLQGEGYYAGTPAVFVRFSGCNLKCSFCDTLHEDGMGMTNEEIVSQVCTHPARVVVLTGGEPGLQVDSQLIELLHRKGKYVTIETNGTVELPESIDWVTCSPKQEGKLAVKRIDEVKVVYQEQDVSAYLNLPARHFFLQPCSGNNTAEVTAYILAHPVWRLSLQTHKLINIR